MANTLYRTVGEVLGRLASLLLFAETGRTVGERGLGAFVFALAFLGFGMIIVDLGLDRYLLRVIVGQLEAAGRYFYDVLALKVTIAVPILGAALLTLHLAGYGHGAEATCWALAPGVFADSVARSQLSLFLAHERGGPPSLADAIQRVLSAILGIVALRAGYGVDAVAGAYSIGSVVGVIVGFGLMARTIGTPVFSIRPKRWPSLAGASLPFATQDVFSQMLARVDALLLALLASQAVVGQYGAAYRLFESTLLVTYALAGAFSAMFTYLSRDSEPTVGSVFQFAVKLGVVALTPVAVAFVLLAPALCRVIYGSGFTSAAVPLRLLAPAVVLNGIVVLSTSLLVSRENPRRIVKLTAVMAGINVVLNLILIPDGGSTGAAVAMLATEVLYAAWILRTAAITVGGLRWTTGVGALSAGAIMCPVCLLLRDHLWPALIVGVLVYLAALTAVERVVSPQDVSLVASTVRRRLASAFPG